VSGDGIALVLVDEYHEHVSRDIWRHAFGWLMRVDDA